MKRFLEFSEFEKVEIRVGKIDRVEAFPEARKPSYKLWLDFGPEIGPKKSSAQLTKHYTEDQLQGKKVLAVVNFAPRQIANFMSEVLVLGIPDGEGDCFLVVPDADVPVGGKLY